MAIELKTVLLDHLPGGPVLRKPTAVKIELMDGDRIFATAPELGLWIDGVGDSEKEALADLARIIRGYRETLNEIPENECHAYLLHMKHVFHDFLTED